jgi:hypothetical protein
MNRGAFLFLVVGWITGCGGNSQDPKAHGDGGEGGTSDAAPSANGARAGVGSAPPPSQGAFWANVKSVSPTPAGKTCPSGASLTFDVPAVDPTTMPPQTLDADTYQNQVVDGEDMAQVMCTIQGASSYTIDGTIRRAAKSFAITDGTLGPDHTGTARITLTDNGTPGFSGTLSAPAANCLIDAATAPGNNFQVKAGSIWAHFSCPSIEQPPSDYCHAEGYFVLENCEQ